MIDVRNDGDVTNLIHGRNQLLRKAFGVERPTIWMDSMEESTEGETKGKLAVGVAARRPKPVLGQLAVWPWAENTDMWSARPLDILSPRTSRKMSNESN